MFKPYFQRAFMLFRTSPASWEATPDIMPSPSLSLLLPSSFYYRVQYLHCPARVPSFTPCSATIVDFKLTAVVLDFFLACLPALIMQTSRLFCMLFLLPLPCRYRLLPRHMPVPVCFSLAAQYTLPSSPSLPHPNSQEREARLLALSDPFFSVGFSSLERFSGALTMSVPLSSNKRQQQQKKTSTPTRMRMSGAEGEGRGC